MAPLTVLLAVALVAVLAWHFRHRVQLPRRARRVECCGCGGELSVRRAVRIVDTLDDIDDGPTFGGGGAIIAEYHRRCVPADHRGR